MPVQGRQIRSKSGLNRAHATYCIRANISNNAQLVCMIIQTPGILPGY